MFWEADIRRAAYGPETISMLSTVLERAVAALPHQERTAERKARLASSILGAAAEGERDPHPPLRDRTSGRPLGACDWGRPHLTTHPWVGLDPQPVRGPHCAPLSVSSWSVWGGDWRDSRRSNCPTLRTPAGNGRPRRAAEISRRQAARQCWPPAIPGRDPAIRSVADDMGPRAAREAVP